MKTVSFARPYLYAVVASASLALAGCGHAISRDQVVPGSPRVAGSVKALQGVTLVITPSVFPGGYKSQALVAPLSAADLNHVVVALFALDNGFETPVSGPDGQPLMADVPASQLAAPLYFTDLDFNTTYRIRDYGYSAPGTSAASKISDDSASYVDVPVTNDDRPIVSSIPLQLLDVFFSGTATATINVIPGTVRYQGSPAISTSSPTP